MKVNINKPKIVLDASFCLTLAGLILLGVWLAEEEPQKKLRYLERRFIDSRRKRKF